MQNYGIHKKEEVPEVFPLNEIFEGLYQNSLSYDDVLEFNCIRDNLLIRFYENHTAYCRMDHLSNTLGVKLLPLSQSDRWLISARILDMRIVSTTDTGLCFFKFRKRALTFEEYLMYLDDLAKTKGLDVNDSKIRMERCGKPIEPQNVTRKMKGESS